jgi:hypothetical protein
VRRITGAIFIDIHVGSLRNHDADDDRPIELELWNIAACAPDSAIGNETGKRLMELALEGAPAVPAIVQGCVADHIDTSSRAIAGEPAWSWKSETAEGGRHQAPAVAHMSVRLPCLVVVSDFLEMRITVVASVIRVR